MPAPTTEDLRNIHEHALTIENTIKVLTKAVYDQRGPQIAMNVLLNSGITTIAGALSAIEDDTERLATTINAFIAIVQQLQLEMAESAAESIIKKAMKK